MILKSLFLIYVCLTIGTCQRVDLTRTDESYGTEVVEAVISILHRSCIFFPDDMLYLRRMAYTDTKDGTDPFTYKINYKGGIWKIDEADFNATKTDPALDQYRKDIDKALYINWTSVSYTDLRKPLLSAIAAQLSAILKSGGIPLTLNQQASLWADHGKKDLDVFISAVQDLEKNSLLKQNLDIVFVLDSSASMSEADFNKSKHYVQNFISELDVDSGLAHVGAVAFSNVVFSSISLDNGMSASQLRAAISKIPYQPGGTNTFDALQYVQDYIFKGSRPNAAKVVVLVTDGRSADNVATISNAKNLRADGVTVFAVGVGGLIDKRELSLVVSEPMCSHLQTVGNFSQLPADSHSGARLAINAPVALKPGLYEFNCSSDVTTVVMETTGRPKTVQVTSKDGAVSVFGSGSTAFVPNSAIYSFNESVTTEVPLDVYVRDGSKIILAFRNDNCHSSFKVKISIGDQIHTGDHKVCIEAGLVSRCGQKDIVDSPFIIKGTPEPFIPNVCGKTDSFTASYPGKTDRYLMCNAGHLIAVYCLPTQRFDNTLSLCVHASAITTTLQAPTKPVYHPTHAPTTVHVALPTTPKPFNNPCTFEHISHGLYIWPFPSDDRKYIKCGNFANTGTVFDCGEHKYFSAAVQTCLYRDIVASLFGPNGVTYDGHKNPCLKDYTGGDVQYYPYPGDPHRFIQCDAYGDAYVKTCPLNEVWEPNINNCIPTGFKYQNVIG
ncbi:uncharacterized protein LOC132751201 isoform X2 [Ruditapes philippinarum]|uniref:uncharacterized protein LOC132751201 isoform X2 n=1 Tax=Ruditapes philippinarum TaxID=129788 RepID=UPI00295AEF9A|nr:uncharacterized protein LOC132751201 isoform X2 [Ruditapes philippinarum]